MRAVIAESYERIHRSNLIGMGVLPLQYPEGENADSLGPDRHRDVLDHRRHRAQRRRRPRGPSRSRAGEDGSESSSRRVVRIDTPGEADYYRNGGILQYVLRSLVG